MIYIKYNQNSRYGVTWNLSGFPMQDVYNILGAPHQLIRLPFESSSSPELYNIVDSNNFFAHHSSLHPDFACIDCNSLDNRTTMSSHDMRTMRQIFDNDERIDCQFVSVKNTFVWYSHDDGAYSAISLIEGHTNFFSNCLNQILSILDYTFSVVLTAEQDDELLQYAKNGLRIDINNVFCDGMICKFIVDYSLTELDFSDLIYEGFRNYETKSFALKIRSATVFSE